MPGLKAAAEVTNYVRTSEKEWFGNQIFSFPGGKALPGARLFNVENTHVRTLRYMCRWGPETAGWWLGLAPKVLMV